MNATPESRDRGEQDSDELFPPLIPLRQATQALGITRKTAYLWRDKGRLTFVKQGERVFCVTAQVLRIKFRMEDESNA